MENIISKSKTTWRFYALACLPFALGLALAVFLIAKAMTDIMAFGGAMERIVVPGKDTIVLSKPGKYTVYNEHKSMIGNKVYSSDENSVSGIECRLRDIRTGGDILLSPSSMNSTYSIGSMEGRAVFDFSIEKPGPYEFGCFFTSGFRNNQESVMAIGQGFGGEIMKMIFMIFGAVAALILSAGATTAIIIVHFAKKNRSARSVIHCK